MLDTLGDAKHVGTGVLPRRLAECWKLERASLTRISSGEMLSAFRPPKRSAGKDCMAARRLAYYLQSMRMQLDSSHKCFRVATTLRGLACWAIAHGIGIALILH